MSSTLTTVLTLAATLIHSVLGCCWHHEHVGAGRSVAQSMTAEASPTTSCCCHHRHDPTSPEQPETGEVPEDDSHSGCHETDCVYTTPDDVQLPGDLAHLAMLTMPFAKPADVSGGAPFLSSPEIAPPLLTGAQRRSWLQVWLT